MSSVPPTALVQTKPRRNETEENEQPNVSDCILLTFASRQSINTERIGNMMLRRNVRACRKSELAKNADHFVW